MALSGERLTILRGLENQDDNIETLFTLWEDLQLRSYELASQPECDLVSFAQTAYYFGVITEKPPLPPAETADKGKAPVKKEDPDRSLLHVVPTTDMSGSLSDAELDRLLNVHKTWNPDPGSDIGMRSPSPDRPPLKKPKHNEPESKHATLLSKISPSPSRNAFQFGQGGTAFQFDNDASSARSSGTKLPGSSSSSLTFIGSQRTDVLDAWTSSPSYNPSLNTLVEETWTERLRRQQDEEERRAGGKLNPLEPLRPLGGWDDDDEDENDSGDIGQYSVLKHTRHQDALHAEDDFWRFKPRTIQLDRNIANAPRPIGIIYLTVSPLALSPSDQLGELNLGIIIDKAHQGKGYAREAITVLLEHAFSLRDPAVHRIQASLIPLDAKEGMLALLTQLRFGHEGTARRGFFHPLLNEWQDVTRLAVLDTDWAMRELYTPAPKNLWDEMFARHERERSDLLRYDDAQRRLLARTVSMETLRMAAVTPMPGDLSDAASSSGASEYDSDSASATSKGKGKKRAVPADWNPPYAVPVPRPVGFDAFRSLRSYGDDDAPERLPLFPESPPRGATASPTGSEASSVVSVPRSESASSSSGSSDWEFMNDGVDSGWSSTFDESD